MLLTSALGSGISSAAPAAKKPTKSEIVIGQIAAATGASATTWAQDAASTWQKWVNANGGINGHPVKVVTVDSKQDPAVAQAKVKELIEQDKMIAMVGENDQTIQAWFPLLADAKIPAIGGPCYFAYVVCSAPPGNTAASPLFFSATTTVPAITQAGLVSAKAAGKKKFGGVVCAEVASCAQVESFYKSTAPALGMEYGGIVKVSASQSDYNAECLQMKQDGIDSAQLAVAEDVAIRVMQDCATQGYKPLWEVIDGTGSEEVLTKMGAIVSPVAGAYDGFPWFSNDPQVKTYRAAFKKYSPGKKYQDSTATAVWAAFELFRKAMANASDSPTSQEVIDAMYKLKDEDLGGLLPQKLNYTQGEPAPFVNCFWLYNYTPKSGIKIVKTSDPSGNSKTSGDLKSDCYPAASASGTTTTAAK